MHASTHPNTCMHACMQIDISILWHQTAAVSRYLTLNKKTAKFAILYPNIMFGSYGLRLPVFWIIRIF